MKSPGTFNNFTKDWYRYGTNDILEHFKISEKGLSQSEVLDVQKKYGKNVIVDSKPRTGFEIFISQFKSPLVYILIIASLVVFALGDLVEAGIIFFIVILNSVIGSVQEGKAENTLLTLKNFIKSYAVVVRSGKEKIVDDSELVPGDIIVLKDGGAVPADARLIQANNLKVNQSILTGESQLVLKYAEPIAATNLEVADQNNMIFRGSYIMSGHGLAVVINTGFETVIGKISRKLKEIKIDVPLKRRIEELSRLIVWIVLLASLFIFIVGLISGREIHDLFLTVVAIAVAAIPESLPVAVTLILVAGVWRMSRKNVLVKKLQAVEALGQATIIAVDKTGTITKNQMTVEKIFISERMITVTGSGYEQRGDFLEGDKLIANPQKDKDLDFVGKTSVLTALADLRYKSVEKEWVLERGDPTEAALLVLGKKMGYLKEELENKYPKLLEIPFDFSTKHHTTINMVSRRKVLFTAGSPEIILEKCKNIWHLGKAVELGDTKKAELQTVLEEMSLQGYRVLALAINQKPPKDVDEKHMPDLNFLAFVCIIDSIRPEVYTAVEKVRQARIRTVMITGDHAGTAKSVAEKVGIFKNGDIVLTGKDLDMLDETSLIEKLDKVSVFARVNPDHKMKIIDLFKRKGEIIAMTGDGINDALSLTEADIGLSMGKSGTEVARQASDLILLDDNFGNIVEAAQEGRNIYWTIRKTVLFLLSTNLGELLLICVAMALGMPLPLAATQIIWLNLVTDTFLITALIFDPKEKNIMSMEYRANGNHILDTVMMTRILSMGVLIAMATLVIFNNYIPAGIEKSSTIALTTLTVFNLLNILNVRSHIKSVFAQSIFNNKYLIWGIITATALHLFAIYNPFMQKILGTASLDLQDWIILSGISISIIVIEEIRKYIFRISLRKKAL